MHARRLPSLRRFHHRRFEPLPYQSQDRAIHHAHPHARDQLIVRNAVEIAGQVRVIHRRFAFLQVLLDDAQRVVRRPAGSKPVRAFLEVGFEDGLQNQLHRRLHHPVPHRRNAQRPPFPIGLGNIDAQHRFGLIRPLPQAPLDFIEKGCLAFWRDGDLLDAHSIYARCPVIAPHRCPRSFQHVAPTHQPVETVEAKPLLLFSFLSQLLSQRLEAGRQPRFPEGKLVHRLFCRRSSHLNQLQSPLTRHDPGQGSLAPSRLDRDFVATMSPSDTAVRPRQRLWLPVRGCPRRTPNRVSQVPAGSFRARCLLSPRRVRSVLLVEASRAVLASPFPAGWPLSVLCNEAEPSSRDATARAFALPSFGAADRSPTLWAQLHDSRPIIMINSSQLTRTSQACLALSGWTQIDTDNEGGKQQFKPRNKHTKMKCFVSLVSSG